MLIFEGRNNKVCDCSHPGTMEARHLQKQKQTQKVWKFHPVEGSAAHKTRDPSAKRTHLNERYSPNDYTPSRESLI